MHWRRLIFPVRRRVPFEEIKKVILTFPEIIRTSKSGYLWETFLGVTPKYEQYVVITKCSVEGQRSVVIAEFTKYVSLSKALRMVERK